MSICELDVARVPLPRASESGGATAAAFGHRSPAVRSAGWCRCCSFVIAIAVALCLGGCSDEDPTEPGGYWVDPDCEGNAAVEYAPAWSPDGEFVAYNHITTCGTYYVEGVDGIYCIRADGTDRRLLVAYGWGPDWSPDGTQIAYSYGPATCTYHLEADSVGVVFASLGLHWPDWSPDGKKIALARVICCPWGICVSNRVTRRKTWLGPGTEPDWSRDGRELVCVYNGLCVLDSSGTQRRQLLNHNPGDPPLYDPHWHPDGSSIVFERDYTLWVIDADGSNLRSLGAGRSPAWSPNGEMIVFAWHSDVDADTVGQRIWIMNADGTDHRQLTFPRKMAGTGKPGLPREWMDAAFE